MGKKILDCQNEMHGALLALEGLRDLIAEADCGSERAQFQMLTPGGLGELVGMVNERFRSVSDQLAAVAKETACG